jgi:hypothetical protein
MPSISIFNEAQDPISSNLDTLDIECLTATSLASLYTEHTLCDKSLILARVCTPDSRSYYYYAPQFIRLVYRISSESLLYRTRIRNPLTNTFLASPVQFFQFDSQDTLKHLSNEDGFKNGLFSYIKRNALDPDECEIKMIVKREAPLSVEEDGENLRFFVKTVTCTSIVVLLGWLIFFYYLTRQEPDDTVDRIKIIV